MSRKKQIIINNITYSSIRDASIELELSWKKLSEYFKANKTNTFNGNTDQFIFNSIRNYNEHKTKRQPYLEGIKNLDFSKEHSFEEIAEIFNNLGLTNHKTSKANIFYFYQRTLEKFQKLLLADEELKEYFQLKVKKLENSKFEE